MTISNSLFAYDKVETVNDKRIITDNYYILLYEYKCSNFNECKKCEQFRWIFSFFFKTLCNIQAAKVHPKESYK